MSGKQTAIITGGAGGIGTGLVEGFLDEGYNVVATSRDANRKLAGSSNLILIDGDIGKQQTSAEVVEAAVNSFGTIDVLVNNAGIFLNKPFTDFTAEDLNSLFSTKPARILLHHPARRERNAETEIGLRCEHHCCSCRSADRRRKWLDVYDYEGRVEFSNSESRD